MLPVHNVGGNNKLCFFFAGRDIELDFPTGSQEQQDFDMTLAHAHYSQGDLTSDKEENLAAIQQCILEQKAAITLETEGVFRIRSKFFTYNQDWQMDVSISINHNQRLLGLLNLPTNPSE